MPAASEPGRAAPLLPALPHTWRPLGPRIAAIVAGGALLMVTAFLWLGFDQETRDAVTGFQRGTVVAMFLLGLSCLYALARSRVEARDDGLLVVNGFRSRRFEWAEIVAVRFNQGQPWVTLDVADGTTASVMAIQGSDGLRARAAARELRALVDSAQAPRD